MSKYSSGITEAQFQEKLERAISIGKALITGRLIDRDARESEDRQYESLHEAWVTNTYNMLVDSFVSTGPSEDYGDLSATVDDEYGESRADHIRRDTRYRIRSLERMRPAAHETNISSSPMAHSADKKDLLVSWSKPISKQVAESFYEWIPKVVPGVQPWISSNDIDKGTEWFRELQAFLGTAKQCVVFVTKQNVRSPWLYYESGAISVKDSDAKLLCPYLVGLDASILSDGPLGKYQGTVSDKKDTLRLLKSFNKRLDKPHNESLLEGNFDKHWSEFELVLKKAAEVDQRSPTEFIETEADRLAGKHLSAKARALLLAVTEDAEGIVGRVETRGGLTIQVGDHAFCDDSDARTEAEWDESLRDLLNAELLLAKSKVLSKVTSKGYKVADALRKNLNS